MVKESKKNKFSIGELFYRVTMSVLGLLFIIYYLLFMDRLLFLKTEFQQKVVFYEVWAGRPMGFRQ
jgi:hypothetical protein